MLDRQPLSFTAPINALTKKRCRKGNTHMMGNMVTTMAAILMPIEKVF